MSVLTLFNVNPPVTETPIESSVMMVSRAELSFAPVPAKNEAVSMSRETILASLSVPREGLPVTTSMSAMVSVVSSISATTNPGPIFPEPSVWILSPMTSEPSASLICRLILSETSRSASKLSGLLAGSVAVVQLIL